MRSIDNLMGCRKICTVSCNYQKAHGVEVSLRSSLRDKVEIWRCPARAMVDVQAGSSQNVLNSRLYPFCQCSLCYSCSTLMKKLSDSELTVFSISCWYLVMRKAQSGVLILMKLLSSQCISTWSVTPRLLLSIWTQLGEDFSSKFLGNKLG